MAEADSRVELILLDEDDFMHPVEEASNFNESAYYNFFDSSQRVGGWVRIGNRPNEGYAEMTVCLYEPDGHVAFAFKRPEIRANEQHDVGGLCFEVLEPWKRHRVCYRGRACVLANPLEMADPSAAFKRNPHQTVEFELDWRGLSPGWGGEPRRRLPDGRVESAGRGDARRQFARGHFEQHGAVRGTLAIGERRYSIDGFGVRDHSWGPRYWQNTGAYRWLTLNFGANLGLAGVVTETPQGEVSRGYLYRAGRPNARVQRIDLETDFAGSQRVHERIRARFHVENEEAPLDISGRVLSLLPCRNRRAGWTTRISEGMTEWRFGDQVGYGMSEYLDHLERGDAADGP